MPLNNFNFLQITERQCLNKFLLSNECINNSFSSPDSSAHYLLDEHSAEEEYNDSIDKLHYIIN